MTMVTGGRPPHLVNIAPDGGGCNSTLPLYSPAHGSPLNGFRLLSVNLWVVIVPIQGTCEKDIRSYRAVVRMQDTMLRRWYLGASFCVYILFVTLTGATSLKLVLLSCSFARAETGTVRKKHLTQGFRTRKQVTKPGGPMDM
jgi:hypothetical protein